MIARLILSILLLWGLVCSATVASAQPAGPSGGLSPIAPPLATPPQLAPKRTSATPNAPSTTPPPVQLDAPPSTPAGTAQAAPSAPPSPAGGLAPWTAPQPAPNAAPTRPVAPTGESVLFVADGLESVLSVPDLRRRLSEALGSELVSLVDPRAQRAHATIWIGVSQAFVVLRVTPPRRPEAWRQLPRAQLGADPAAAIVSAVLETFWADSFGRIDVPEIQDPFCPPGLICVDARRSLSWPPPPDIEVLDPWDPSYRRYYGWDPFAYPPRYRGSAALTAPYPGRDVRARVPVDGGYWVPPAVALEPVARPSRFALSMFAGGGVHGGGAFFRYEVDAVRRFRLFDFGLAYIGARGEPEPPTKARRAITAMLARRFVAQDFEIDLGASFGTFFATFEGHSVEVRPYLRGMATFALPIGRVFDLLVQSDLATTFASVPETGAVEYALSLGLRHRM